MHSPWSPTLKIMTLEVALEAHFQVLFHGRIMGNRGHFPGRFS